MSQRKRGYCYAFLWIALSLFGCGGGGGGTSGGFGGDLRVDEFVIPAGETRVAARHLTVYASTRIQIDGKLIINPGITVSLYSDGPINITGAVEGAPSTRALSGRADARPPALRCDGGSFSLTETGTIQLREAGAGVFLVTTDPNGVVTINGKIETAKGTDGAEGKPGSSAGAIEVGTETAIRQNREKFAKAAKPGTVTIAGRLQTGAGGKGWQDTTGKETTETGGAKALTFTATDGGNGGDIRIQANSLQLDVTKATLQTGAGGAGGRCGSDTTFRRASDGQQNGERGWNLRCRLGSGGRGGDIQLTAQPALTRLGVCGIGGNAGGLTTLAAGNGGPSGAGGDTAIVVGLAGRDGRFNQEAEQFAAREAAIVLANGGNGGPGANKETPGGRGGSIEIVSEQTPLRSGVTVTFRNYANGGAGFNGWARNRPIANGTNGGDGGKLTIKRGTTETDTNARLEADPNAFNGGRGGDGYITKTRGEGGKKTDKRFGKDGEPGELRGGETYEAVELLEDLKLGTQILFRKGDCIALDVILDGRSAGIEAMHGDHGCPDRHYHTLQGKPGIRVVPGAGQEPVGPFPDPQPTRCGFGLIVQALK